MTGSASKAPARPKIQSSVRGLILGGEGMLGRAMAAEGRRRGWPALALGRGAADVTRPESLAYWLRSFRPEVVFNCAAYTAVDRAEEDEAAAYAVNAEGAESAARAAREGGARLVHVSTDYVFPGDAAEADRKPYREGDETRPESVYGASKLAGERAVLEDAPEHLVVRTSWLFGPLPPPRPGVGAGGNFVATMARLIREGRVPLRVVADQEGCPTYTPYLARALWDLAALGGAGVVHYRNREPVSWHGFAEAVAHRMDPGVEVIPISTDEMPRPARRPAYSVLDVGHCETLLGRRVEPWSAGLEDYLKNHLKIS